MQGVGISPLVSTQVEKVLMCGTCLSLHLKDGLVMREIREKEGKMREENEEKQKKIMSAIYNFYCTPYLCTVLGAQN